MFRCIPLLLASSILGLTPLAHAGPIPSAGAISRDLAQTMQARQLLHDDADLVDFNIGVTVQNRVATLFGPVPSAEVIFRAELCLRTMIGLVEIRNELFVSDLLAPVVPPIKLKSPPLSPPDTVPPMLPRLPNSIFTRPDVLLSKDEKPSKQPLAQKTSQPKPPVVGADVPRLGPPEFDKNQAEPELAGAIRTLLSGKSAFKGVRFTIQDRRVFLSTLDENTDALHEAARAIARLPGVDGVVLMDKPNPR